MNIVIVGGSNISEYLTKSMLERGHRITIIEEDSETIDHLAEVMPRRIALVEGDGCDAEAQRDAGLGQADLFMSLAGHDETNLVACELAMINFNVPRCIALVSSPKNERIFREIGIEPVSPAELIARMVEEEALIGDMRMVFSLREGDITMVETHMPKRMKCGSSIRVGDMHLPRHVKLIAVVRDDDFEIIVRETVLMPGETIIAAAKSDAEDELRSYIKHL